MARRVPPDKKLDRKLGNRSPKFKYIAICEGQNTEPEYLQEFVKDHGNGLVEIETVTAGVPLTIVQRAIERKREYVRTAKKNGFEDLFEVWAIFDIDEHPNIPQALRQAKDNNIFVARSNPCFEIWPVLHFEFHRAYIHRHALQKKLESLMPSYQKSQGKKIDYLLIRDQYKEARARAAKQLEDHDEDDSPYANPSTDIFKLLDKIIKQGKRPSGNQSTP
jgi:hypothetical protein